MEKPEYRPSASQRFVWIDTSTDEDGPPDPRKVEEERWLTANQMRSVAMVACRLGACPRIVRR